MSEEVRRSPWRLAYEPLDHEQCRPRQCPDPSRSFRPGFKRTNTNDLIAPIFPPLKAIVPGYAYCGFTVLAGRQKPRQDMAGDRRPRADLILRQHPRLHLPDISPPRLAECIFLFVMNRE